MRLYLDAFSGEEIISDSFDLVMVFDDAGAEIKSKLIVKKEGDVDIGCGNAFGGNEAEEEKADDQVEKVIDVVDCFHYKETSFNKADYSTYIKGYMKKVLDYLTKEKPDRVAGFKKGASAMVKFITANYADFTFYTPESYDTENSIILSYYKGEDASPTFLYFMDGLIDKKL